MAGRKERPDQTKSKRVASEWKTETGNVFQVLIEEAEGNYGKK